MPRRSPAVLRHGSLTSLLKPLDGCPDVEPLLEALPSSMPVIWLDSARQHPVTGRWSLLGYDPWLRVIARGDRLEVHTSASTQFWRGHPLEALRQVWRRYHVPAIGTPIARAVGLMGWLSYDLNRWIERLPPPQPPGTPVPELAWFGMRVVLLMDHVDQRSWLLSTMDPHRPTVVARREAREALDQADALLAQGPTPGEAKRDAVVRGTPETTAFLPSLQATTTAAEFQAMVLRALDYIRAGEIFQANVSQRFTAPWSRRPLALYRRLRQLNPSPFACFLSCEDLSVVSCSPERLVLVDEGRIRSRPIAGTRPRGQTAHDDAMNSLELLLSEKERAEHIMLVDLARNDLGRVSRVGTVSVDELMTLEAYSHVIHIVSDISGVLRPGVDPIEVIRAVFPGGTITGCPKIRCMEILRELEPVARGLYTGSIGYLGFDGTMDLNIVIRTIVLQEGELSFHVGAGIVADSDPSREYDETLAKAGALMSALAIDATTQGVHAGPR